MKVKQMQHMTRLLPYLSYIYKANNTSQNHTGYQSLYDKLGTAVFNITELYFFQETTPFVKSPLVKTEDPISL